MWKEVPVSQFVVQNAAHTHCYLRYQLIWWILNFG